MRNLNNPTYITYDQEPLDSPTGSSALKGGVSFYKENEDRTIKNTVSSSFDNITASFQRQTYISKIGIYDDDKNLIAIAKLANPIRKRLNDEYTFKLQLDI